MHQTKIKSKYKVPFSKWCNIPFVRGFRNHKHKFISTKSGKIIWIAAAIFLANLGYPFQNTITCLVTITIIDVFEPVNVQHHNGKLGTILLGFGNFIFWKWKIKGIYKEKLESSLTGGWAKRIYCGKLKKALIQDVKQVNEISLELQLYFQALKKLWWKEEKHIH